MRTRASLLVLLAATPLACVGQVSNTISSASAEAEARVYRAIDAAVDDVAAKLVQHKSLEGVKTYILYDNRLMADVTTERTFKVVLDRVAHDLGAAFSTEQKNMICAQSLAKSGMRRLVMGADRRKYEGLGSAVAGAISGISLTGLIQTLYNIGQIGGQPFSVNTGVSGVAGPSDAESLLAGRLRRAFDKLSGSRIALYEPGVMPFLPGKSAPASLQPAYTWQPGHFQVDQLEQLAAQDPVTELYYLQSFVASRIQSIQNEVDGAYREFSKAPPPATGTSGAVGGAANAYSQLVTDLRAAIAWTAPAAAGGTGVNGSAAGAGPILPLSLVRADINSLRSAMKTPAPSPAPSTPAPKPRRGRHRHPRDEHEYPGEPAPQAAVASAISASDALEILDTTLSGPSIAGMDRYAQLLVALNGVIANIASTVNMPSAVSSGQPGGASPELLANVVIRGWQISTLLSDSSARVLRVRLEMAQATDKTHTWLWRDWKDSSAMAQVSFAVFSSDSRLEFGGNSLAYLPLVNGDSTMGKTKVQFEPVDGGGDR